MRLGELLRTKSSEYELLAEWHAERAPLDEEHFVASQAIAVVGIALLGVLGALTAVPLAATIQIFVQELTKARREKVAAAHAAVDAQAKPA